MYCCLNMRLLEDDARVIASFGDGARARVAVCAILL